MAKLSPILGFLIILKDSFKLIFKNVKFMAPITLLSLLLPSILVLLFSYIYHTLDNSINNIILSPHDHSDSPLFPIIAYISLRFFIEVIFLIAFFKIYQISGIATILVSTTTYTSTPQLYSRIKTVIRSSKQFGYHDSKNRATRILALIVLVSVVFMALYYSNPITISIAVVVWVSGFVFQLYESVPMVLSCVVSVVEEKYERSEALERAEELIEGHRGHGFMINLLLNLVLLIIVLGVWLRGELWSLNLTVFGLFFVNFMSLGKIFGCVAYTVLYFRCNNLEFDYSKLTASDLGGDIP